MSCHASHMVTTEQLLLSCLWPVSCLLLLLLIPPPPSPRHTRSQAHHMCGPKSKLSIRGVGTDFLSQTVYIVGSIKASLGREREREREEGGGGLHCARQVCLGFVIWATASSLAISLSAPAAGFLSFPKCTACLQIAKAYSETNEI